MPEECSEKVYYTVDEEGFVISIRNTALPPVGTTSVDTHVGKHVGKGAPRLGRASAAGSSHNASHGPRQMVICTHCGCSVRSNNLDRHIRKVHSGGQNSPDASPKRSPAKSGHSPIESTLQPKIHKAETSRPTSGKIGFPVKCPYCQVLFPAESDLAGHICRMHMQDSIHITEVSGKTTKNQQPDHSHSAPPAQKQMVLCRYCGCNVRSDNLDKHIRKAHPEKPDNANRSQKGFSNKSGRLHGESNPLYTDEEWESLREALQQSQWEAIYGDKYMGYMRREEGKFGSLPLYDDYGEEEKTS